jgi:hypothetical protein
MTLYRLFIVNAAACSDILKVSGVSVAAGLRSGQINQKRNSKEANPPEADKYRMSNKECRMSK